jgi:hypothetical protein
MVVSFRYSFQPLSHYLRNLFGVKTKEKYTPNEDISKQSI